MKALVELGVLAGAIVAILTLVTLIARLPPIRWLWGQLVSNPLGRWAKGIIREGAVEFHNEMVRPQISSIETKVNELILQGETSWHKDKAWMVGRVTRLEDRYEYVRDRQLALTKGMIAALKGDGDAEQARERMLGVLEREAPVEPGATG